MTLSIDPGTVEDRQGLAAFVEALLENLTTEPETWENADLPRYLEAMAAWLRGVPGLERNTGLDFEAMPRWQVLARALDAAAMYE